MLQLCHSVYIIVVWAMQSAQPADIERDAYQLTVSVMRMLRSVIAVRKKRQKNTRQVCNEAVSEIELATDQHDVSFRAYIQRNADLIHSVVNDYHRRLRYATLLLKFVGF